jgi:hypothetical protein
MALPDSTYAVVKSGLRSLARLARVENLICRSYTSSSDLSTSTYEGPGKKITGGDTSEGGKDERETQRPWFYWLRSAKLCAVHNAWSSPTSSQKTLRRCGFTGIASTSNSLSHSSRCTVGELGKPMVLTLSFSHLHYSVIPGCHRHRHRHVRQSRRQ